MNGEARGDFFLDGWKGEDLTCKFPCFQIAYHIGKKYGRQEQNFLMGFYNPPLLN
jgi:hypothetical protein